MKNLLYFFFPSTQKIQTEKNGVIEITSSFGKKLLNSSHANYSYGTLQRILNFGLKKINLSQVENILLLGLGGGCVISSLRNRFHYKKKITAVDFDKIIIDIALKEFQLESDPQLIVHYDDAFNYVLNCNHKFGLIIIDLFIDNKVPDFCFSSSFWNELSRLTLEKGKIIFNATVSRINNNRVPEVVEFLKNKFTLNEYDLVEGTNTVLVGEKKL